MFTGIITDIGTVRSAEERGDRRLVIGSGYDLSTVDLGASIACSGACLTVVDKGNDWFAVDVSHETQSRTVPGQWDEGARLNLERSLRVGDELGGHIVTGHVDAVATVTEAHADGGSIALDGVSLTVNSVGDRGGETMFTVNLIPHTLEATTLNGIAAGRQLNVEIDILARYLERMTAR
jgi:riboflavin synthase